MPFIRIAEESFYVGKFGELLESLSATPRDELMHRYFRVYWFPHYQLCFISNHEFWWRYFDFQRPVRVGTSRHFMGWHNVKVFGVPICFRE